MEAAFPPAPIPGTDSSSFPEQWGVLRARRHCCPAPGTRARGTDAAAAGARAHSGWPRPTAFWPRARVPAPAPGRVPWSRRSPECRHPARSPCALSPRARLLGRRDNHRDKPCARVHRLAIGVSLARKSGCRLTTLGDDAPLPRLAPPPPGRIRPTRPRTQLLRSIRHLRSCPFDWWTPPRCPPCATCTNKEVGTGFECVGKSRGRGDGKGGSGGERR